MSIHKLDGSNSEATVKQQLKVVHEFNDTVVIDLALNILAPWCVQAALAMCQKFVSLRFTPI